MKGKSLLLLILLFFIFFKNTFQQPFLFPFGINNVDEEEEEQKKGKKIKDKNEDDEQNIVETKHYQDEDGNNITITRIHYRKSKHLNGNPEAVTPFQMMRIFDDRVNSIFEDMIRQSMGIKMLLNGLSMIDDDENESEEKSKQKKGKSFFDDFEFEEEEKEDKNKNKNKAEEKKDNDNEKDELEEKVENDKNEEKEEKNGKSEKNGKRALKKEKTEEKEENIKKFGKLKVNMDNVKSKIKKNKKRLNRRELIFSRVCKYIFYSIILFTIYILTKKLLILLEIIDPDNAVEIKIENDETSKLKKTTEEKQN